jgi:hypothetical protein
MVRAFVTAAVVIAATATSAAEWRKVSQAPGEPCPIQGASDEDGLRLASKAHAVRWHRTKDVEDEGGDEWVSVRLRGTKPPFHITLYRRRAGGTVAYEDPADPASLSYWPFIDPTIVSFAGKFFAIERISREPVADNDLPLNATAYRINGTLFDSICRFEP